MGSRSKFHKSDVATTLGRALFHMGARRAEDPKAADPRRAAKAAKKVRFTDAFWDALRGYRAAALKGEKRPPHEAAKPRKPSKRGLDRAARALAKVMLKRTFGRIPDAPPRAERRRAALAAAQHAVSL